MNEDKSRSGGMSFYAMAAKGCYESRKNTGGRGWYS
jgi:hypothetical protein